jgi:hypothetical protein
MPKRTVSDFLLDRLEAWGVKRVYGYAGDGIDPILGALRRAGDRSGRRGRRGARRWQALAAGDPDRAGVERQMAREGVPLSREKG